MIDGLVDAAVIKDDGPAYVHFIVMLAPEICGVDGLELIVIAH
jgi:hypothetical protein